MKSSIKFLMMSCFGAMVLLSSCSKEEIVDTSDLYIITGHLVDVNGDPLPLVSVEWYDIERHNNILLNTFTNFHVGSYDSQDRIASVVTDEYGFLMLAVDKSDFNKGKLTINGSLSAFDAEFATQSIFFEDNDFIDRLLTLDVQLEQSAQLNISNNLGWVEYTLEGEHQLTLNDETVVVEYRAESNETVTHNMIRGQTVKLKYDNIDTTFVLDQASKTFNFIQ